MENKEKQMKEDPKNPQQVQIEPAAENLSEAELEKAAGGGQSYNVTKSNVKTSA